jgi:hypothetical protein
MPRSCFPLYPDRSLQVPYAASSSLELFSPPLSCPPSHHLTQDCPLLYISSYLSAISHILALPVSPPLRKYSSCDCPYRSFYPSTLVYFIARNSFPYFFLFLSLSLYCFTSSGFLMCCCLLSKASF